MDTHSLRGRSWSYQTLTDFAELARAIPWAFLSLQQLKGLIKLVEVRHTPKKAPCEKDLLTKSKRYYVNRAAILHAQYTGSLNPSPSTFTLSPTNTFQIVETMSYNSDVASFLSVDDDEQGFPNTDLELVAGDVLARVRSQHNSPVCKYCETMSCVDAPYDDMPVQVIIGNRSEKDKRFFFD